MESGTLPFSLVVASMRKKERSLVMHWPFGLNFFILFNLLSFRLEDITLGDFKEAIDRPGMFRYHFKALDPEFGTVKEEV